MLEKDMFGRYKSYSPADITGYEASLRAVLENIADVIFASFPLDEIVALSENPTIVKQFVVGQVNRYYLPEGLARVDGDSLGDLIVTILNEKIIENS